MEYFFWGNDASAKRQRIRKLAADDPPVSLSLFGKDQMTEYCKTLARRHKLTPGNNINDLLEEISCNEKVLTQVYELLTKSALHDTQKTGGRELVQTNFYIILDQIEKTKSGLLKLDIDLPRLNGKPGMPRIYNIATRIVAHTDSQIECDTLLSFIAAYQSVSSLRAGELKALCAVLKLALIANLRRRAVRLAAAKIDEQEAAYWADKITAAENSHSQRSMLEDLVYPGPTVRNVFVTTLTRLLQRTPSAAAFPLQCIHEQLGMCGQTINELMHSAAQERIADRVSVRNSISSLRILDTIDWQKFIDTSSVVEPMLCRDSSGIYAGMDSQTREHYRNEVGKIAKQAALPELEVARWAVLLSMHNTLPSDSGDQASHVGFFLTGPGRCYLERSLGVNGPANKTVTDKRHPFSFYLGGITGLTLLLSGCLLPVAIAGSLHPGLLVVTGLLLALTSSYVAKGVVDLVARSLYKPALLPRLDFSRGIPSESRTLVIVPAMLTHEKEITELVRSLEIRFLANRNNDHLHFGLVTDFRDAKQETMPADDLLVQLTKQKIEELNIRYGSITHDIFFLFHRPRKWNARERIWMGFERKRGKLMELNTFLRGAAGNAFSEVVGNRDIFPCIKYIITLDADTQLPREAAWKLVATLAHPLNRAIYSEEKKRVVAGYGMLQPKVGVDLRGSNGSLYHRMNGIGPDIDPYTKAAPDLYQDIFAEGSFIGKGIYDIDIMIKAALHERFPENRILSHDLLEGCYVRSGLVSDVYLYERPLDYLSDVKRRHRWIRGDWQIAAWTWSVVPAPGKRPVKNPLSPLSRWKILDNLRSSLLPSALMLLLILGWTVLPHPLVWTLFVISVMLAPGLLVFFGELIKNLRTVLSPGTLRSAFQESASCMTTGAYGLVCLPFEAFYTLDAVVRAGWRMLVSGRRLLEWVPASELGNDEPAGLLSVYRAMWAGPLAGIVTAIGLSFLQPALIPWVTPLLLLWISSPAVAFRLNRAMSASKNSLSAPQQTFLHTLARKTWAYFEDLVRPETNWLPPDHYQEYPYEKVADYTSPTNMGLALLANLTAWDFGFISTGNFIARTVNTIKAMERLERYRGHFYNWYNIRSLKPSLPRYVSTVDSGNLAGHLFALRHGISDIPGQPVFDKAVVSGLQDTLELFKKEAGPEHLPNYNNKLMAMPAPGAFNLKDLRQYLESLTAFITKTEARVADPRSETAYWFEALKRQCQDIINELNVLAPWLDLLPAPEKYRHLVPEHIPTLTGLAEMCTTSSAAARPEEASADTGDEAWLGRFNACIEKARDTARKRLAFIDYLVRQCSDFSDIEFDFLYNPSEQLLSIGYNVKEGCMDTNCYDVLASEARLATFVGISQNKLPVKSWFALARPIVSTDHSPALLSANGTMFEYLMPLLVMPTPGNTLLDLACKAAVRKQIAYGAKHGMPWGISESCYASMDANLNYQYKVFGIPGLSLKHDHSGDDKVIAPYASALALMVAPDEACKNLEQLSALACEGRYGLFEAVDYTPSRISPGQSQTMIRSYMAHHQGMSFISFSSLLSNNLMQKRFENDPQAASTLLLLQERIPKGTVITLSKADGAGNEGKDSAVIAAGGEKGALNIYGTDAMPPQVQLLSNGRDHVLITSSGKAYRRWNDISITRRPEHEHSYSGVSFSIRCEEQEPSWPVIFRPAGKNDERCNAFFSPGCAAFHGFRHALETRVQLMVSPEDDLEVQQLTIRNHSGSQKVIELTGYADAMLLPFSQNELRHASADPYQTEIAQAQHAIVCGKHPALPGVRHPWMFFKMTVNATPVLAVDYRTDQSRLSDGGAPGLVIQYKMIVEPGGTVAANIFLGIGEDRSRCEGILQKCRDQHLAEHLFKVARQYRQAVLQKINATEDDAERFRQFTGMLIFGQNIFSQNDLTDRDVSPLRQRLVLLRINRTPDIEVAVQLVQMHAYWRLMGLNVNLVIWNEDHSSYHQFLQRMILDLVNYGVGAEALNRHEGGITIRSVNDLSEEDYLVLETADQVIVAEEWNSAWQLKTAEQSGQEWATPALELA